LSVVLLAAWPRAVQVAVEHRGRGAVVCAVGTVEAPFGRVSEVVRDIGDYPHWFPRAETVRYQGDDTFALVLRLPWPFGAAHETLRFMRRSRPHRMIVSWHQLHGDLLRDEGQWTLAALGPTTTQVRYQSLIQLRPWVPLWLLRRAARRSARVVLQRLEWRAASAQW
jgi:hypothetical protein